MVAVSLSDYSYWTENTIQGVCIREYQKVLAMGVRLRGVDTGVKTKPVFRCHWSEWQDEKFLRQNSVVSAWCFITM
jgi:hypothetical protein